MPGKSWPADPRQQGLCGAWWGPHRAHSLHLFLTTSASWIKSHTSLGPSFCSPEIKARNNRTSGGSSFPVRQTADWWRPLPPGASLGSPLTPCTQAAPGSASAPSLSGSLWTRSSPGHLWTSAPDGAKPDPAAEPLRPPDAFSGVPVSPSHCALDLIPRVGTRCAAQGKALRENERREEEGREG